MLRETLLITGLISILFFTSVDIRKRKSLFLDFFPWHKMYKKKIPDTVNYEEN